MKKILFLFSGGKDSFYSLQKLMGESAQEFLLVSIISKSKYTYLHSLPEMNEHIRLLQLESLPIPHREIQLTKNDEEYLFELIARLKPIRDMWGATHLATGDLWNPRTQKINTLIAKELNIRLLQPGKEDCPGAEMSIEYMKKILDSDIKAVVIAARKNLLDSEIIGKIIDASFIRELIEANIDPSGESGEYHSFVVNSPIMTRPICVESFTVEIAPDRNGEEFYRMTVHSF